MIINEVGRCPTRSDYAYFEQSGFTVFTAAFCFANGEHNLIKPWRYNSIIYNSVVLYLHD